MQHVEEDTHGEAAQKGGVAGCHGRQVAMGLSRSLRRWRRRIGDGLRRAALFAAEPAALLLDGLDILNHNAFETDFKA